VCIFLEYLFLAIRREKHAKYLDAGSPLEPLLPLFLGNRKEELG